MTASAGASLGEEAGRRLVRRRRDIQPGLTVAEFDRMERQYGFEFADDHRGFLSVCLPVGSRNWPDWRSGDPQALREKLAWPVEGVVFDVEHNAYWYDGWGSGQLNPVLPSRWPGNFSHGSAIGAGVRTPVPARWAWRIRPTVRFWRELVE